MQKTKNAETLAGVHTHTSNLVKGEIKIKCNTNKPIKNIGIFL